MVRFEISFFDISNLFEFFKTYKYASENPIASIIPYQYILVLAKLKAIGFKAIFIFKFGKDT